jgi:hypothetical protein
MKKTTPLIIALLLFTSFSPAFAAKRVVVLYKSGCDYYIAETNKAYAILEWYGGNDPSEGNVLVGDFETYGMKDIYNLTADAETNVWVEDFWLSKSGAIEKYYEKCN